MEITEDTLYALIGRLYVQNYVLQQNLKESVAQARLAQAAKPLEEQVDEAS